MSYLLVQIEQYVSHISLFQRKQVQCLLYILTQNNLSIPRREGVMSISHLFITFSLLSSKVLRSLKRYLHSAVKFSDLMNKINNNNSNNHLNKKYFMIMYSVCEWGTCMLSVNVLKYNYTLSQCLP